MCGEDFLHNPDEALDIEGKIKELFAFADYELKGDLNWETLISNLGLAGLR
jgi:hypothetical protein